MLIPNTQENLRKTIQQNKTQAYSTPRAEAQAGPGRPGLGPGSRAQTGGAVGLRFIVFLRFSFVFGMHMPLLSWKLILGWISFQTYV